MTHRTLFKTATVLAVALAITSSGRRLDCPPSKRRPALPCATVRP